VEKEPASPIFSRRRRDVVPVQRAFLPQILPRGLCNPLWKTANARRHTLWTFPDQSKEAWKDSPTPHLAEQFPTADQEIVSLALWRCSLEEGSWKPRLFPLHHKGKPGRGDAACIIRPVPAGWPLQKFLPRKDVHFFRPSFLICFFSPPAEYIFFSPFPSPFFVVCLLSCTPFFFPRECLVVCPFVSTPPPGRLFFSPVPSRVFSVICRSRFWSRKASARLSARQRSVT